MTDQSSGPGPPPSVAPMRVWPVFIVYLGAFFAIFALSGLAAAVLASMYPEVSPANLLRSLPGLLAGGLAASVALVLTVLLATRAPDPVGLRLAPGRETGRQLLVMILGVLALGQVLDSVTTLLGLTRQGALWDIRQALGGAAGPALFAAVVVIGPIAGTAEELFFRAFMQTRLRARWSPGPAIVVTSACFALMHLDWVHAGLAFSLGLYLGFITERAGSALPAIACHVINNSLFTVVTASVPAIEALWPNVAALAASGLIFGASVIWLARTMPSAS